MKNQYEIDYQQGYDAANEEWLDRVKQAREEIDEYKKRQLTLAIGIEDLERGKQVALDYVIVILDKLIAESEE